MRTARTLLIGTVLAAVLATGCEWHFETLDGAGGPDGRIDSHVANGSSVIVYNGRPHVFYYDHGNGDLRHAYWNGQSWAFETLDGAGGANGRTDRAVGDETSALLYNGRPHVFYRNLNDGHLRHAYWNGQFWAFEVLDGAGGPNGRTDDEVGQDSAAILYNGRPHVFYRNNPEGHLRHGYWNGFFWAFEVLDGAGGPNGRTNAYVGNDSAVVLYNGRPHAFYGSGANGNLRHAYYTGAAWGFETLDGNGGPNGRIDSDVGHFNATILYQGRPQVFYGDDDNGTLRHAYYTGSAWGFETLDGAGGPNGRIATRVGAYNAAVLYENRPHVFYRDSDNTNLRHAYYSGSAWGFETLDGNGGPNGRVAGSVGTFNAAVLYNGRPDVFYKQGPNGELRHAYFG